MYKLRTMIASIISPIGILNSFHVSNLIFPCIGAFLIGARNG